MVKSARRIRRRQALAAGGAGLLMLPGKAPARGGAKKLSGVTLNVTCRSASCPQYLARYIPEFEQATGARVNYETPSFPIRGASTIPATARRSWCRWRCPTARRQRPARCRCRRAGPFFVRKYLVAGLMSGGLEE